MGFISENLFGQGGDTGEQAAAYAHEYSKRGMRQATAYGKRQMKPAFDEAREHLEQYDVGPEALGAYQDALMGGYDFTQDPLYQAQMQAAADAIASQTAGTGSLYSGARGQLTGAAAAQAGLSAYDRYMSGLSKLMGIGGQASSNLANLAINRAGTLTDLEMGKTDYLNQLMRGSAQTHMDIRAQQNAARQQMYGGLTGFGLNILGGFIPGNDAQYSPPGGGGANLLNTSAGSFLMGDQMGYEGMGPPAPQTGIMGYLFGA